jgi:outer membrane lipoprotein
MKNYLGAFSLFFLALLLCSCAPVLSRGALREGERNVSFKILRDNPAEYIGGLYVLGGIIVQTKLTPHGSEVEAMHVPVNRYGYFEGRGRSEGRFIAVMPAEQGVMDPEVFTRGRGMTIAGRFTGIKKEKIDDMEYAYPVFEINDFYLWPNYYQGYDHYYPGYYYDPRYYPRSYDYWDPWWGYPRYNYYFDYYYWRVPPVYRGAPPPSQPPPRPPSLQRPERPGVPRPESREFQAPRSQPPPGQQSPPGQPPPAAPPSLQRPGRPG